MGVTVEIESSISGRPESIQMDSKDEVDLFTIPASAEDDPTLVFHITGIDTPIKFRLLEWTNLVELKEFSESNFTKLFFCDTLNKYV